MAGRIHTTGQHWMSSASSRGCYKGLNVSVANLVIFDGRSVGEFLMRTWKRNRFLWCWILGSDRSCDKWKALAR
jgi:hypothetical protein